MSTHETETCPLCFCRLPAGIRVELCPVCACESAELDEDPPTRMLNGLELLEIVGKGGMGVVWKARQLGLNRLGAVKTLTGGEFASEEARNRFRLEAEVTARLKHEGIVPVPDVGEEDGTAYLVMELVEGRTLRDAISELMPTTRLLADWMRQIALAFQHAHDEGVLHRDLKPSNILIDEHARPRVTDFGLAKLLEGEADLLELTHSGKVTGSPSYMSPEQARGDVVNASSDVYGLGATFYHALVGRPPSQGDNMVAVLTQVARDEPIPPRRLNPGVPKDLETICLKCLEKSSSARYESAGELADDLERFLQGKAVKARPISPIENAWRITKRHPWRAAAALLSIVLLGTIIASLVTQNQSERTHNKALSQEQQRTRLALARARMSEVKSILQLRRFDSRTNALNILSRVDADPRLPQELQNQSRDLRLAALSLDAASVEPFSGTIAQSDDYTMVSLSKDHAKWSIATFPNTLTIHSVYGRNPSVQHSTAPHKISMNLGMSETGRYLALRHYEHLGIWELNSDSMALKQLIHIWPRGSMFSADHITFLPDDDGLIWADHEGRLNLMNFKEGNSTRMLPLSPASPDDRVRIGALSLSRNGARLLVVREDQPIAELRRMPNGQVDQAFREGGDTGYTAGAIHATGHTFATGTEDGRILIWNDAKPASPQIRIKAHGRSILGMRFSHDGRHLAS